MLVNVFGYKIVIILCSAIDSDKWLVGSMVDR
jgi:hypothetical protein